MEHLVIKQKSQQNGLGNQTLRFWALPLEILLILNEVILIVHHYTIETSEKTPDASDFVVIFVSFSKILAMTVHVYTYMKFYSDNECSFSFHLEI